MSRENLRGLKSGATVGERLRAALDYLDLKQVEFSKKVPCTQAFISMVMHDRCGPSTAILSALEPLGISAQWLMTGAGQMLRSSDSFRPQPLPQPQPSPKSTSSISSMSVRDGPWSSDSDILTSRPLPILGRVPAGSPGPSWVEEHREGFFPMSYELVPDPNAFVLRVTGASMSPEIEEGDLVVVSPALAGKVKNGDLVVARRDGADTWVKRLSRTKTQCFLVSSNPSYAPILLDPESESTIIGKVVYTIHHYK